MIKIKNSRLLSEEFFSGLRVLYTTEELSVKTAVLVMRIAKAVDSEVSIIRELAKEFTGETKEEKIAELLEAETEIPQSRISVSALGELKLSAATLSSIEEILDFEDEV